MTVLFFQENLLKWYKIAGRHHLPWQNISPYHTWLSEIMLQQTQVSTVIPYYQRFIEKFPCLEQLAQASEDEVLGLWAGLGYYHRGKNLLKTAKIIHSEYNNKFPETVIELQKLPGVGPSTAAAIASQAFNLPEAILDGNVKRVLARFFGIEGPINDKGIHKKLEQLARDCMPKTQCQAYTQAIMDLGATCCTPKKASCESCFLKPKCQAYLQKKVDIIPGKAVRPARKICHYYFLLIQENNKVFLIQRPSKGIWPNLWCFPELKEAPNEQPLFTIQHNLTHQRMEIAIYFTEKKDTLDMSGRWVGLTDYPTMGIPKPIYKALSNMILMH